MPNSDLTQQHRVGEILTYNRLEWSFGLSRSSCIGFKCVSISYGFANLVRFWPKSSSILSNLARSNESSRYSSKSIVIQPRSHWVCQDLVEISLYRQSQSLGLSKFRSKLAISNEERTSLWAGWVRWFLRQPNRHLNLQHQVLALATCGRTNHRLDLAVMGWRALGSSESLGLGRWWIALIIIMHSLPST